MMIPITRKEKYINEIVGGGNTAPETPYTRKELFYADILGEVVAPSPITRAEKYLAKIANKYSGELPEPVTRIERFLARAAGMDVTIPTPITREEMFWADYALIVEKELSGIPPLTFKAKKAGTLKNYRIYGQTVDGESVGDRTENLFDKNHNTMPNAMLDAGGIFVAGEAGGYLIYAPITPLQTYTFRTNGTIRLGLRSAFTINKPALSVSYVIDGVNTHSNHGTNKEFTRQAPLNANWIVIQIRDESALAYDNMLNLGSTALPYEPYGYKIPVTLTADSAETTDIYLDEPLAKSGNNADYIDYAAQKRHNSDGTESSVTLPEISTLAGTNTLTVGTEVQPSNVYIKYEGVR